MLTITYLQRLSFLLKLMMLFKIANLEVFVFSMVINF